MPAISPYAKQQSIRLRGKGIPSTNVTNELATAVNNMRTLPNFGQRDEGGSVVAQAQDTLPIGQYPGQVLQVRTNNSIGYEFVQLTPPVFNIPSPST